MLDTVGLSGRLEQLIIIYNETLESYMPSNSTDQCSLFYELRESQLPKYASLRYFELSLYNDASEPSMQKGQIE